MESKNPHNFSLKKSYTIRENGSTISLMAKATSTSQVAHIWKLTSIRERQIATMLFYFSQMAHSIEGK